MQGMSEDEGDAEDEPEVTVDDAKNEAARKAREERQEKLRKMMDDDGRFETVLFDQVLTLYRRGHARCTRRSRIPTRSYSC